MYGRPDAPRAWYIALSEFIMDEMKYERSVIDPALFIRRDLETKEPVAMLVIHVDDVLVATNGSDEVEEGVNKFCERFPLGEWDYVAKQPHGVTYCGKEITVSEEEGEQVIHLSKRGFTEGRLELIPVDSSRKRS